MLYSLLYTVEFRPINNMEKYNLKELVQALGSPLSEDQVWALCFKTTKEMRLFYNEIRRQPVFYKPPNLGSVVFLSDGEIFSLTAETGGEKDLEIAGYRLPRRAGGRSPSIPRYRGQLTTDDSEDQGKSVCASVSSRGRARIRECFYGPGRDSTSENDIFRHIAKQTSSAVAVMNKVEMLEMEGSILRSAAPVAVDIEKTREKMVYDIGQLLYEAMRVTGREEFSPTSTLQALLLRMTGDPTNRPSFKDILMACRREVKLNANIHYDLVVKNMFFHYVYGDKLNRKRGIKDSGNTASESASTVRDSPTMDEPAWNSQQPGNTIHRKAVLQQPDRPAKNVLAESKSATLVPRLQDLSKAATDAFQLTTTTATPTDKMLDGVSSGAKPETDVPQAERTDYANQLDSVVKATDTIQLTRATSTLTDKMLDGVPIGSKLETAVPQGLLSTRADYANQLESVVKAVEVFKATPTGKMLDEVSTVSKLETEFPQAERAGYANQLDSVVKATDAIQLTRTATTPPGKMLDEVSSGSKVETKVSQGHDLSEGADYANQLDSVVKASSSGGAAKLFPGERIGFEPDTPVPPLQDETEIDIISKQLVGDAIASALDKMIDIMADQLLNDVIAKEVESSTFGVVPDNSGIVGRTTTRSQITASDYVTAGPDVSKGSKTNISVKKITPKMDIQSEKKQRKPSPSGKSSAPTVSAVGKKEPRESHGGPNVAINNINTNPATIAVGDTVNDTGIAVKEKIKSSKEGNIKENTTENNSGNSGKGQDQHILSTKNDIAVRRKTKTVKNKISESEVHGLKATEMLDQRKSMKIKDKQSLHSEITPEAKKVSDGRKVKNKVVRFAEDKDKASYIDYDELYNLKHYSCKTSGSHGSESVKEKETQQLSEFSEWQRIAEIIQRKGKKADASELFQVLKPKMQRQSHSNLTTATQFKPDATAATESSTTLMDPSPSMSNIPNRTSSSSKGIFGRAFSSAASYLNVHEWSKYLTRRENDSSQEEHVEPEPTSDTNTVADHPCRTHLQLQNVPGANTTWQNVINAGNIIRPGNWSAHGALKTAGYIGGLSAVTYCYKNKILTMSDILHLSLIYMGSTFSNRPVLTLSTVSLLLALEPLYMPELEGYFQQ